MFARSVLTCSLLLASPAHMFASHYTDKAPNVVTDWAAIVQPARASRSTGACAPARARRSTLIAPVHGHVAMSWCV